MSGIGNPNAGGPGFKRLTGKRRFVPPEKRKEDWEAWRQTLTPEERATVDENDRLSFLNAHKWNATERMKETGCGEFDEHGNFVEGSAGRSTVWDKDPDGRWVLHQCPIAELPAALLRKDRFLHQHPGWFRDRPIFESVYLGMVKKPLSQSLTDFEYAELARLYMRYQHVLTAEPLCDFIEYFFLQRGITLEELFKITQAIHEVGTVYDFDPLGRSVSSGIGDMALEIIRGEEEAEEVQEEDVRNQAVANAAEGPPAPLDPATPGRAVGEGNAAMTSDESVEADLADP